MTKICTGYDLFGHPFNKKYPPNKEKYGIMHDGYKNMNREALFYDFAVMCYDVSFRYKGKNYYLLTEKDHAAVCDEKFNKEYETFPDENTLIEQFKIDGKALIDIIDELEDVDVW